MPAASAIPTIVVTAPPDRAAAARTAQESTAEGSHVRFRDVLSALNPLQYLPVVGTIYRAVTGDTIPEGLRMAGSLLVSGLMGGPVGVFTTIATTIAERVTGIDPDKIAHIVLADIGLGVPTPHPAAAAAVSSAMPAKPTPAATPPLVADWTTKGLATAGVTFGTDGSPAYEGLSGADALNQLELTRVRVAAAAYAHTAALHS